MTQRAPLMRLRKRLATWVAATLNKSMGGLLMGKSPDDPGQIPYCGRFSQKRIRDFG